MSFSVSCDELPIDSHPGATDELGRRKCTERTSVMTL